MTGGDVPHPDDFHIPTPDELWRMRVETGLSQKEASERAGVAETTIRRIETNTTKHTTDVNPSVQTIMRMLAAYEDAWGERDD